MQGDGSVLLPFSLSFNVATCWSKKGQVTFKVICPFYLCVIASVDA
jgi:hypothetical protein